MKNLNAEGRQALSGSAERRAAIKMIRSARKAGPHRFRRLAEAVEHAARHGGEEWRYISLAEGAVTDACSFANPRSHRHLPTIYEALQQAYETGAHEYHRRRGEAFPRERGRRAADIFLSNLSRPATGPHSLVARQTVEAVAWATLTDAADVAAIALDALNAYGLVLSPFELKVMPKWAEWAVADRPITPEWAPPEDYALPEPLPPPIAPFAFENLPGLLGEVARWSHRFAFKPVPEFAVLSALAAMSVLFGRRYATPTSLGLNLYLVGIAPTGGGKEAALSAPQALLDEAGFSFLLGPGDFTSDSAIEKALRSKPCQAMFLDEFGQLLGAVQGRNAPSFAKLARKALLELFTKSGPGGRWTGKARASDDHDNSANPVYSPTLSLLGCSTVEGFFESLTLDNLADGFVNRLVVVRAKAVGARNMDPCRTDIPEALVAAVRAAYEVSKIDEGNMPRTADMKPAFKVVPWADAAAETEWLAVADWEDVERESGPGRDGIVGRVAEHCLKLATLAALSREPGDPAVTVGDVRWAFALARSSIDTIDEGVRLNMAGSDFEALVKAVERALRESKSGALPVSQLLRCRGVSKADPRMVDNALRRLEQLCIIEREIGPVGEGAGRPRNSVRLIG